MGNNEKKVITDKLILVAVPVLIAIAVTAIYYMDIAGEAGNKLGKDFNYDVSKQAVASSENPLYEESQSPITTGLKNPRAVAVDIENNIYVAGDSQINIFNNNDKLIRGIKTKGPPRCLFISKDKTIYAGTNNTVEIYDSSGKEAGGFKHEKADAVLTSIAVSGDNIFVADAGNRLVARYNKKGELLKVIGQKDKQRNIPGFSIPSPYFDLAIADDGLLRVVNPGRHKIEAYTFNGDLEFSWGDYSSGVEGFCGCCNPVNFAMTSEGQFVTCEKGLVRVKVYDEDGKYIGLVAGPEQLVPTEKAVPCETPEQCQLGGFDVAVDGNGRVIVMDTLHNTIRIFEKIEIVR